MSSSAAHLAAQLHAGGQSITRANRVGVEKACLAGKNVMLASLTEAAGGLRLKGVGRRGAKVGVRYDVKGFQNPVGIIRYRGPVHLVNSGTRPHTITTKRRGKKALSPAGNPWAAASAEHPGTPGKKFHDRAAPLVIAQSKRIITTEVRAHLARSFAG